MTKLDPEPGLVYVRAARQLPNAHTLWTIQDVTVRNEFFYLDVVNPYSVSPERVHSWLYNPDKGDWIAKTLGVAETALKLRNTKYFYETKQ